MLHLKKIVIFVLSLFLIGCSSPPVPPEVAQAEKQEQDLWRVGAPQFTPENYNSYKRTLRNAKDNFIKESNRFVWFRDYNKISSEYQLVLLYGNGVLKKVESFKSNKSTLIESQLSIYENKLKSLDKITLLVNEGRYARRNISKASLAISEVRSLCAKEKYVAAEKRLSDIPFYLTSAERTITPIVSRFADRSQIAKWRQWADETISESRRRGTTAIVVCKIERTLTLYRDGRPVRSYQVGLGRNGFHDKVYAGDFATPEGKYHITKKVSNSRYYKALLINYPNDEDRRQFATAKKKGLIPSRAGIGGLIEIHGGGDDGMTYGCISLENQYIDELFRLVGEGTPVTIVGALEHENVVTSTIRDM
ncbi:MAG: L,D-transpeptidase family protein [Candidatus Schekmanbacteria bacterium]|nr:L,D-transpeptidase family protein [Candidatus Schekmanbacteria bacterium]